MNKQYKFQFNNDMESCYALATMLKDGWCVVSGKQEEGFTFLLLEKFFSKHHV